MWLKLKLLWEKNKRIRKRQIVKAVIEVIAYLIALALFVGWAVTLFLNYKI